MKYLEWLVKELVFPSPYRGLFFYLPRSLARTIKEALISFRPHTGDYFFIAKANTAIDNISDDGKFPSPYWGLFFLSLPSIVMITSAFKLRLSAEFL